jgi:hypothetical protein
MFITSFFIAPASEQFFAVGVCRVVFVVVTEFLRLKIMFDQVKCVISKYQQRLMETPFVPSSFGQDSLRKDGDANKLFLKYLFDMDLGSQFLKDVGLRCRRCCVF